ncbi:DUF2845 domain-containing protein [Neptunicella sp. SCSIO 80796]|uniref:DUF2845 domain-containing protein n=1 Tax=Neptunicella plasticusilytica TaxID=3117012 RepID=UPI003A4D6BAD
MNKSLLVSLLLFCNAGYASTDLLRCKNKLVMEGDSTYEVKNKCGEPDSEQNSGYVKFDDAYVKVTTYFYDFGSGRFLQILEFRDGKLYSITEGPRN